MVSCTLFPHVNSGGDGSSESGSGFDVIWASFPNSNNSSLNSKTENTIISSFLRYQLSPPQDQPRPFLHPIPISSCLGSSRLSQCPLLSAPHHFRDRTPTNVSRPVTLIPGLDYSNNNQAYASLRPQPHHLSRIYIPYTNLFQSLPCNNSFSRFNRLANYL